MNNEREEPGFYAVIPATVRYDKSLSPNAKLLYGEITALAKKEGYCWASNNYFAELYGVNKSSVTHWIKSLENAGYVRTELVYHGQLIVKRNIYISNPSPGKKENRPAAHEPEPGANEGGGELFNHRGEISHQGVVKFSQGGGEISQEVLIQDNNTNLKAAAAASEIPQNPEKPPPEKAAADSLCPKPNKTSPPKEQIEILKLFFRRRKPALLFDEGFYSRVLRFLDSHSLDLDFVSWMFDFCVKKKPESLAGYFYKVVFQERYVLLYRQASQPPPPEQPSLVPCPACGSLKNTRDLFCPSCRTSSFASKEEIEFKIKFLSLPKDRQDAYSKKEDDIFKSFGFAAADERKKLLYDLKIEFGLLPQG